MKIITKSRACKFQIFLCTAELFCSNDPKKCKSQRLLGKSREQCDANLRLQTLSLTLAIEGLTQIKSIKTLVTQAVKNFSRCLFTMFRVTLFLEPQNKIMISQQHILVVTFAEPTYSVND